MFIWGQIPVVQFEIIQPPMFGGCKEAHKANLVNTGVIVGNYPTAMAQDKDGRSFLCNCNIIMGKRDEFFAANSLILLTSDNTKNLIKNLTGETVTAAIA